LALRKEFTVRRFVAFPVAALLAALVFAQFGQGASAHEHRHVLDGKYEFTVGFRTEPAVSGELNSIELRVVDLTQATPAADGGEATGAPVEGLEETLTVQILFADQSRELDLEPRFDQPGAYNGWVIPVQPGDYAFHITGTINGEAIDEIFTPGPETFSSVRDRTELEFPAAEGESAANVVPMGAISGGDGNSLGSGGGAVLLGLAVMLALVGAFRVLRRPGPAPVPVWTSSAGD
jgi:hypothetical protein